MIHQHIKLHLLLILVPSTFS